MGPGSRHGFQAPKTTPKRSPKSTRRPRSASDGRWRATAMNSSDSRYPMCFFLYWPSWKPRSEASNRGAAPTPPNPKSNAMIAIKKHDRIMNCFAHSPCLQVRGVKQRVRLQGWSCAFELNSDRSSRDISPLVLATLARRDRRLTASSKRSAPALEPGAGRFKSIVKSRIRVKAGDDGAGVPAAP